MRLLPILSLLPALAIAVDQKPLVEKAAAWLEKAKSYIPLVAPPSPIDAGASKAAGLVVERITNDNWREKMLPVTGDPSKGPQEWMVMFSGNTSCNGRCIQADQAFNESATILSAEANPPKLGRVDCDKDNLLCTTWSVHIPEIWHFLIAVPTGGQPRASSPLHIVPVFRKNVTTQDILKIHTEKSYLDRAEYTGVYHPIDGRLQQFGILEPLGYVMWGFGSTPSWLLMIVVSVFSKKIMSRRTPGGLPNVTGGRPPAQAGGPRQL